jgi:hypothetical protein
LSRHAIASCINLLACELVLLLSGDGAKLGVSWSDCML